MDAKKHEQGGCMFRIAICDDEMTSLMINKALTEQILEEEGIEYDKNR